MWNMKEKNKKKNNSGRKKKKRKKKRRIKGTSKISSRLMGKEIKNCQKIRKRKLRRKEKKNK